MPIKKKLSFCLVVTERRVSLQSNRTKNSNDMTTPKKLEFHLMFNGEGMYSSASLQEIVASVASSGHFAEEIKPDVIDSITANTPKLLKAAKEGKKVAVMITEEANGFGGTDKLYIAIS